MNKIGRQGRQWDNRLRGVCSKRTKDSDFYTPNVLGHWNFQKIVPGVLRTDVEFLPWSKPWQIPTPAPACRSHSLLLDGPFKTYRPSTPAQTAPDRPCDFSCSFEQVPRTPYSWSDSFRARDPCGEGVSLLLLSLFIPCPDFLRARDTCMEGGSICGRE